VEAGWRIVNTLLIAVLLFATNYVKFSGVAAASTGRAAC